jgi:hypothetical protein
MWSLNKLSDGNVLPVDFEADYRKLVWAKRRPDAPITGAKKRTLGESVQGREHALAPRPQADVGEDCAPGESGPS